MKNVLHQIWREDAPLPARIEHYARKAADVFTGWDYKLWRRQDLKDLRPAALAPELLELDNSLGSEAVRWEILHQHGGLHLAMNVEILRPETPQIFESGCFAYANRSHQECSSDVLYCPAGHLLAKLMLRLLQLQARGGAVEPSGSMRKALDAYVGAWVEPADHLVGGIKAGEFYSAGEVLFIPHPLFTPYQPGEDSWQTFLPELYPAAFGATHSLK
jgi:hypothetical protein